MEEDEQNLKLDDSNQLVLKNLLISKADEEVKEGASSSNENKKETEEAKDSPESPQKEEGSRSKTPVPGRSSPEPSCAICLEQLQNKSFTDSCFHMFCFTCLVEWSKVKPECPLCKQSFKSIVHNVRSFKEYDQYYINKSRISENLWTCVTDRRFRYNTTLTPERYLERSHPDYSDRMIESEIASHRMRYAPHSVHPVRMYASSQSVRRVPCSFRRRIYDENLWVRRQPSSRVRCISPAFFRRNIACTHRLLPWLNRELLVVMPNNESQISFVIELIMALIVKYEITSQEFYTHIEPYTSVHTSHFIHEFYNFAVSPYESMESYDLHAEYTSMSFEAFQTVSSPDSDVIPLPVSETVSSKSAGTESKRKKQHRSRKKHVKEHKNSGNSSQSSSHVSSKIILIRKSGNCWSSSVVSSNVVPFTNQTDVSSSNPFEVPGPSTSRETTFPEFSTETSNQDLDESNEVECLAEKDDECQVVEVLKPRGERTPEIVNLSSDEETENFVHFPIFPEDNLLSFLDVFVDEVVPSASNISADIAVSDDDDIIFVSETNAKESTVEKPIDYSMKNSANEEAESASKIQEVEPCSSSSRDNTENEISHRQNKISVIQSAIRSLNNDNDTCSSSWSPAPKPKKRRAVILDDSSTESCSESAQVSELDTGIKKLKLRSVVAHFSFDPSDHNSSLHHSSSHKKHKEKKKKKKKHKHKRRIYSSDSN